ncbi:hypothetical protein OHC33_008231 [Knufia fluminis]|uniref:Clr5 domain-containing protein n=1 Tax=Knufia fluminis TaxID=191047 RepID=A0AAN8ERT9_9EURO|nr:hypothetical protein OHC33_008231 [Knufia fluminis]
MASMPSTRATGSSHTKKQWEAVRPLFTQLYIDDGKTLREVRSVLEHEHAFVATTKMFKSRITQWQLHKYRKHKDFRTQAEAQGNDTRAFEGRIQPGDNERGYADASLLTRSARAANHSISMDDHSSMMQLYQQMPTLGVLQPFERALSITGTLVAAAPDKRSLTPDAQLRIGDVARHLAKTSHLLLHEQQDHAMTTYTKALSAISTFTRQWSNHTILLVSILYQLCQNMLVQGPAFQALLKYMAAPDSPIPNPLRYVARALVSTATSQRIVAQRLATFTHKTIPLHLVIQVSGDPLSIVLCEYRLKLDSDHPSLEPWHNPTPRPGCDQ